VLSTRKPSNDRKKSSEMNKAEKDGQVILSEDFGKLRKLVPEGSRVVVLYDRNVEPWFKRMADPAWKALPLDAGEELKQWDKVEKTVETFLEWDVDRSWFLVGMGGGTVCDFAGFIGSVYMRGMPFGLVPTTLLAQTDAALGGKNGIHFGRYKNMIGCTVLPRWVFCNLLVLETLPAEEFRCGLAECIKHGVIADASYFSFIKEHVACCTGPGTSSGTDFCNLPLSVLRRLVQGSQEIKVRFIEEDLLEQGVRKALNFGHTFGHAIAACHPSISHGQAVARGMALAATYSVEQGRLAAGTQHLLSADPQGRPSSGAHLSAGQVQTFLSPAERDELVEVLIACGLDVELPCPEREIIPYMLHDKKRRGEDLQLVLLSRIGQYVFSKEPVVKWENRSRNPGVCLGASAVQDFSLWIDRAPWVELRLDLMPALSPVALLAFRMQCMGKEHRLMLTQLGAFVPDRQATAVPDRQATAAPDRQATAVPDRSAVGSENQTLVPEVLAEMISWGVGWVDVPIEAPAAYVQEVTALARQHGAKIIRSAHFWGTSAGSMYASIPSEETLNTLAEQAFSAGADFLKIAVHTQSRQESDFLLSWCDRQNSRGVRLSGKAGDGVPVDGRDSVPTDGRYRVTVMIMGDDALRARQHALHNGYPFVYAAPDREGATAPGQPSFEELAV
jgi:3-dehydroquinate synthase